MRYVVNNLHFRCIKWRFITSSPNLAFEGKKVIETGQSRDSKDKRQTKKTVNADHSLMCQGNTHP